MTFDHLWLAVSLAIGAGMLISYFLGRFHGLEVGLSLRQADELSGDRPTAGDARTFALLNNLHETGCNDAGA